MLRQTYVPEDIVPVWTHPKVFVNLLLPASDIDILNSLVTDTNNVCLVDEGGGFLFYNTAPTVYDVHSAFLPEHRGPRVVALAKEALDFMFSTKMCSKVTTFISQHNRAARRLALAVGFLPVRPATIVEAGHIYEIHAPLIRYNICH